MFKLFLSFVTMVLVLVFIGNHYKQVNKSTEEQELRTLIDQSMNVLQPKISPFKKKVFTDTLVRVTMGTFDKQENRKQFIIIVGIESGLNPEVGKSKADAVGPAQILGKYAKEFGKMCNLPEFDNSKDIHDPEINLMLGSCLFKNLNNSLKNPSLAALAYNAGKHSKSMDQLLKLGTITNQEASSYVSKFSFLAHKFNIIKY